MKRKAISILICVCAIVVLLAVIVVSINHKEITLPPLVELPPVLDENASPYEQTFREATLMSMTFNDILLQGTEGNVTYEQYVKYSTDFEELKQELLNEANLNKRIPEDLLKRYNNSVKSIWGPQSIFLIDEKKNDRDIQAWIDGFLFYSFRYRIWYDWVYKNISDEEYYLYMQQTQWENLQDICHENVWELIEWMAKLLEKSSGGET